MDTPTNQVDNAIRTQRTEAIAGTITPEMVRVAEREGLPPELVRDEVGRGRLP